MQHKMRIGHIVTCGLFGGTIFFHIISQKARYAEKKEKLRNVKSLFRISLQILSETFLIQRRTESHDQKYVLVVI